MSFENCDMESYLKYAQVLHGHLDPFLVIGVRIAILAKKELKLNFNECNKLIVTVHLPLMTPFSCILDGIQISTQSTIGNQRLRIEDSPGRINVHFSHLNSSKES